MKKGWGEERMGGLENGKRVYLLLDDCHYKK